MAGTIVQVLVATGDVVRVGQSLVILESMKMEHVVQATEAGTVEGVAVIVGDSVVVDQALVRLSLAEATAETPSIEDEEPASEGIRPDLQAVIDRHAFALDENRPHAVERRRSRGQRTARENIADLVDEDTFVEYGALAHAAQRARRDLDDLIRNTPADGLVAGIGTINQRGRCVVMSYDATVLAGTQGMRNHQKTDRMLQIAEAEGLALVLFAEAGGGRPGDTDTAQVAATLGKQHQRQTLGLSDLQHPVGLLVVAHALRASQYRRVVRHHDAPTSLVDRADASDETVGRCVADQVVQITPSPLRRVGQSAVLDKRVLIDQIVDVLPRGALTARPAALDGVGT